MDDRPTKQSDCYAFGMVVYKVRIVVNVPTLRKVGLTHDQVLCGKPPYWEITNPGAVIHAIMEGD